MDWRRFDRLIDARFPYLDRPRARSMICLGTSISTECSFQVLHEIARPPTRHFMRQRSTRIIQHELLTLWRSRVRHPLARPLAECAKALIDDRLLPTPRVARIMRSIARFPDQGSALNIASWACRDDEAGDRLREAVIQKWGWPARQP